MTGRTRAAFAAAFLLAVSIPAQALAQSKIAVMDSDRVLNESAVGQDIKTKLTAIAQQMDSELQAEGNPVKSEWEAFQGETSTITREEFQARPDLVERGKTLQNQIVKLNVSEQVKAKELVATKAKALQPVRAALDEVLQSIVDSKNIDVLVERDVLIYARDTVVVTDDVIAALNANISTTPVERVRIPIEEEAEAEGEGGEE